MASPRDQLNQLLQGLKALEASPDLASDQLRDGLMSHVLGCMTTLGSIKSTTPRPIHDHVFKSAIQCILDRNEKLSNSESIVESFPTKWIHGYFPGNGQNAGWLPLHWCALISNNADIINSSHLRGLISENSALSIISTELEVSPTSLAVATSIPSHDFFKVLLEIDRDVVKLPDRDGAMALMYAGAWNDNTTLLEKIYALNPKAISATDAYGFLPLHFACYAGTVDSISFLLSKYPDAARVKNRAGVLPLLASAANSRRGGVEMARILLDEYPDAISVPDDEGSFPLHIAAQFASFDLIRFLYAVYPAAASTSNSEGLLPMHFAGLRKEKNIEIVDFLTEANTDAEAAQFVPVPTSGKEECTVS